MKRDPLASPQLRLGHSTIPQLWKALMILSPMLFLALAGCGEPTGKVSGTVTYRDKAVPGGTVVFVTDDFKRQERVPIQPDGTYSSSNVPVGMCKVAVEPAPKGVKANMPKGAGGPPKDTPEDTGKDVYNQAGKNFVDIPWEFRDPKTSNLTTEVKRGEQTFNIPLFDVKKSSK
jgi:hypothetical protein